MLREGESPHPVPDSRKKNSVCEDNSLEKGVVSILPAANERSGFVADNVRDFGCFPVKTRHAQNLNEDPDLNFAWVNKEKKGPKEVWRQRFTSSMQSGLQTIQTSSANAVTRNPFSFRRSLSCAA